MSIINQRWKKGPFSKEEDEIIIQRRVEASQMTSTGRICNGLWTSIGLELNRSCTTIHWRWNSVLSKDKRVISLLENKKYNGE